MQFVLMLVAMFFTSVANAANNSVDDAATLKKGASRYHIGQVVVELENNRKLWTKDATVALYPDQAAVQEMIVSDLRKQLEANNIYAGSAEASAAVVDVQVKYRRSFIVGKGVTYPFVSFTVAAKNSEGQELASYQSKEGLLQAGGRKSIAQDQKIMLGKYNQDDEREDIATVANWIYEAVANIGQ